MKERKERGYLLRTYPLGESSLIAVWWSEEHGLIKTVIKNPKGRQSAFEGNLEPFSLCELHYNYRTTESNLHLMLSLRVLARVQAIRKSYHALLCASYFAALPEYWLPAEHKEPELYQLFTRALHYLDTKPIQWRAILYYEQELSKYLGYSNSDQQSFLLFQGTVKLQELRNRLAQQYQTNPQSI